MHQEDLDDIYIEVDNIDVYVQQKGSHDTHIENEHVEDIKIYPYRKKKKPNKFVNVENGGSEQAIDIDYELYGSEYESDIFDQNINPNGDHAWMEFDSFIEYTIETDSKKDDNSHYLDGGIESSNDEIQDSKVKYYVFKPTIDIVDCNFMVGI